MTDTNWSSTALGGVLRRRVEFGSDERGSFGELWRTSWTVDLGLEFVQLNLSRSRAAVLRGVHFHERQHDLWIVLDGRAHVALVDLRPALAGDAGPPAVLAQEMGDGDALLIPPGVAHGFRALEPLSLLYVVTNEYDGTDEHGFAWDDPVAAIAWPTGAPILSARDASAPSLLAVLALLRRGRHISD